MAQECHICLEELRRELTAAPCGHVFHLPCMLQALQVQRQCPICRRSAHSSDLVSLYLEIPPSSSPSSSSSPSTAASPATQTQEASKLSARVNALMERVQWQKRQSEALLGELERLRAQKQQLASDKQLLAQRAQTLEAGRHELLAKLGKYQLELGRQAEAARRASVNRSIASFLDTCDADALEDEVQNPRELIKALKKACKFRHEQYQKVVKDKLRLKAMLQQQQQQGGGSKPKPAAYEAKRAGPVELHTGNYPSNSKKRRMGGSTSSQPPAQPQMVTSAGLTARTSAYSDVPMRPVMAARHSLVRSQYNPNQYGAFHLTPASSAPVSAGANDQVVCRRGYDETGKLTTFFLPQQSVVAPGMALLGPEGSSAGAFQTAIQRQKAAPSMRNLLNDDDYAPTILSGRDARAPASAGDRREYTLTSWLRPS